VERLVSLPLNLGLATIRPDAGTTLELDAVFDELAQRVSTALASPFAVGHSPEAWFGPSGASMCHDSFVPRLFLDRYSVSNNLRKIRASSTRALSNPGS
jgi:hypothetical protein